MTVAQTGNHSPNDQTACAVAGSGSLGSEHIELVSRLENLGQRISNPTKAKDRVAAVETARTMLIQVLDFLETTGGGHIVERFRETVARIRDEVKKLDSLGGRTSWMGFSTVKVDEAAFTQQYQSLCNLFRATLTELFAAIEEDFTSADDKREWREIWRTFVDDLTDRCKPASATTNESWA